MNAILDYFGRKSKPTLVLCNPNMKPVSSLGNNYNLSNSLRFNAISELSFDYPQSIDNGKTIDENYNKIQVKMVIELEGVGKFIISECPENSSGEVPVKHVVAQSLESELLYKRITALEGTFKFYDNVYPADTILGRVLKIAPGWTIGTIDNELSSLYRTFDVGNNTVYNFLTNDVANAFGCVFIFDKFSRTISAKLIKNLDEDSGIILTFDNVNLQATLSEFSDEIATALTCYGGKELDIQRVNPLGGNTIYNFDYYINDTKNNWMSNDLKHSLIEWNKKIVVKELEYKQIILERNTLIEKQVSLSQHLNEMKGALDSLYVTLEGMIAAPEGKFTEEEINQAKLDVTNQKIAIRTIRRQKANYQKAIDGFTSQLMDITHSLKFSTMDSCLEFIEVLHEIIDNVNKLSKGWRTVYFESADELELTPEQLVANAPHINSLAEKLRKELDELLIRASEYQLKFWLLKEFEKNEIIGFINKTYTTMTKLHSVLNSLISHTDIVINLNSDAIKLRSYTSILDNESNLNEECYIELQNYMFHNTYTNSNIIITDIMSEKEIQEQSQELYNQAVDVLERTSKPRYEFSGDFVSIINLKEFNHIIENLELGSIVKIELASGNVLEKSALLEISYNYDEPDSFDMVFSNRVKLNSSNFKFADLFLGKGSEGGGLSGITSGNTSKSTPISGGDSSSGTGNVLSITNALISKLGFVSFGPTPPQKYGNYVGSWLGYDNGAKFSLYSSVNDYLQWDGQKLLIKARNFTLDSQGNITANNANLSGKISATTGNIGGWIIGENSLYSGLISLDSLTPSIKMGDAYSFMGGSGVFIGRDSDDIYKLRVGNPDGDYLSWDGTKLDGVGYLHSTDLPFELELMKMSFQSLSWSQFAIFDGFEDESKRRIPEPSTYPARISQGTLISDDNSGGKSFGFYSRKYPNITTVSRGNSTSVGTGFLYDANAQWFTNQYKGYLLRDSVGNEHEIITCEPNVLYVDGNPSSGSYDIRSKLPTTTVLFCSFKDSSNGGKGYTKVELSFDNEAHFKTILDTENDINNIGGLVAIDYPGRDYSFKITLKNDVNGESPIVYKILACTDPSVWQ